MAIPKQLQSALAHFLNDPPPDLDSRIRDLEKVDTTYRDLVAAFPDVADAYIVSPNRIPVRDLARTYASMMDEDDPRREHFETECARRAHEERWMERRAQFQSARSESRREVILESEAQVWAVLALDYHATRIRHLWRRWEDLDTFVQRRLEALAEGAGGYTQDLNLAMKELREVELSLTALLPKLNIDGRAAKAWEERGSVREELVKRIDTRLRAVVGAQNAEKVFELLDGGSDE